MQHYGTAHDGLFRASGQGGGIFGNRLAGLGSLGRGPLGAVGAEQSYDPFASEWHEKFFAEQAEKGGDYGSWPWNVKSPTTLTFQQALNKALVARGYAPVKADGVLGPGTCGAARLMHAQGAAGLSPPKTCQSFGPPPPCVNSNPAVPSPCTAVAPPPPVVAAPPPPPVVAAPPPAAVLAPRKPAVSRAALVGGALAVTAVAGGVYWYGKQKGWFG